MQQIETEFKDEMLKFSWQHNNPISCHKIYASGIIVLIKFSQRKLRKFWVTFIYLFLNSHRLDDEHLADSAYG